MVFDGAVDLREIMYMLARFFAHESCGKVLSLCAGHSAAIGDRRARPALRWPSARRRKHAARHRSGATQTSLCGLGQTAASAILSAVDRWPELMQPDSSNGRIVSDN